MKTEFDEIIPRRGTASAKWDRAADGVLPMWVADMDFRTAPPVIAALEERVRHGIFGYASAPDAYYEATRHWYARRYGFAFARDWMIATTGVVPALSAIIGGLTEPGDKVIVQTPVYNLFFSSIRNMGCEVSENRLMNDGGVYSIHFNDLEARAADPRARILVLCNPHNPVGRAWTRAELTRIGDICAANGVFVISDEIHCDLVLAGHQHVPFATLGKSYRDNSATCVSPSKSFNLAGLQVATIVAADPEIRARIDRQINLHEVSDIGPLGIAAATAAYSEGEAWLEAMKAYVFDNYLHLKAFMAEHLPQCVVTPLEATYLVWIDCAAMGLPADGLAHLVKEKAGLWLNDGASYGADGKGFLRINIACPRPILEEGLARLERALTAMAPA